MKGVSTFRLWVLRAAYLLIAVGIAFMVWPGLINVPTDIEHARGVMRSLLAAVGLLAVIGLRYPLQMLPVLFFELVWKTIWLLAIYLPQRTAGSLSAAEQSSFVDCVFGVVVCLLVIPWSYVFANYVRKPAEPFRDTEATA